MLSAMTQWSTGHIMQKIMQNDVFFLKKYLFHIHNEEITEKLRCNEYKRDIIQIVSGTALVVLSFKLYR